MNIQGIKTSKNPGAYHLELLAQNGRDPNDCTTHHQYYRFPKPECGKFDDFFLQQVAPKTLRNRKDYFKKIMLDRISKANGKRIQLLYVAGDPARDLYELYRRINPEILYTACVNMDENAIRYTQNLNAPYLQRIDFIHSNIFKFSTERQYDVIWSAGLFDYFEEEDFVAVLKRMRDRIRPGGEIVIGNCAENNSNRTDMERLDGWFLHHRSELQLQELALAAGFAADKIRVGKEKEGVNLFLHLGVS